MLKQQVVHLTAVDQMLQSYSIFGINSKSTNLSNPVTIQSFCSNAIFYSALAFEAPIVILHCIFEHKAWLEISHVVGKMRENHYFFFKRRGTNTILPTKLLKVVACHFFRKSK